MVVLHQARGAVDGVIRVEQLAVVPRGPRCDSLEIDPVLRFTWLNRAVGRGDFPVNPQPIIDTVTSSSHSPIGIPNGGEKYFYIVVADDLGNPLTVGTAINIDVINATYDPNNTCSFEVFGETEYTIDSSRPYEVKRLFEVIVFDTNPNIHSCNSKLKVEVTSENNGDKALSLLLKKQ